MHSHRPKIIFISKSKQLPIDTFIYFFVVVVVSVSKMTAKRWQTQFPFMLFTIISLPWNPFMTRRNSNSLNRSPAHSLSLCSNEPLLESPPKKTFFSGIFANGDWIVKTMTTTTTNSDYLRSRAWVWVSVWTRRSSDYYYCSCSVFGDR